MEAYGSIGFARSYGEAMATAACDLFDATFAGAGDKSSVRFIRELIPYMVSRSS
jgi:hypothetical protein